MRSGLGRRLAAAAFGLATTCAFSAPADELTIELALAPDGALLVSYTPPAGVGRITRFDRLPRTAEFWRTHVSPVDDCASFDAETIALRAEPRCRSARFRVAPGLLARYATYEPAQPLGGAGLIAYMGYYAAGAAGHGVRWRWLAPAEGYVVQDGRVERALATQAIDAAAVDAAFTRDRFDVALRALSGSQYVFLGRAPLVSELGRTLVRDPALDDARFARAEAALAYAMRRLGMVYGVMPAGPVAVVATVADTPGFQGDTTDGRMMRLRFSRAAEPGDDPTLFVSHEVVHWWNAGVFRSDMQRPWLHEGHADWMALLLNAERGLVSAPAARDRIEQAFATCLLTRAQRPAAELPPGYEAGDDPYACGLSLMLLAQAERSRTLGGAAPGDALALMATLHRADAPLDMPAFARWADGGDAGAMHRLLFDPALPFAAGFIAEAQALGLADAPEALDDAQVPDALKSRVAAPLMAALMRADCDGAVDLWTLADRFRLGTQATCSHLRGGAEVVRIAGLSPFTRPITVWRQVAADCAAQRPIAIDYADGSPTEFACPQPLPPMPLQRLLRLRPGALAALGLAATSRP